MNHLFVCALLMFGTVPVPDLFCVPSSLLSADNPQEIPQVKKRVDPPYPKQAVASQQEGEAFIKVSIDAAGKITSASVMKATTKELGTAALEAARQWEFGPAVDKSRKPVKSEVTIPFRFRLGDQKKKNDAEEPSPVPIHRENPQYPETAKKENREGMVVVEVEIDIRGNVSSARVLKSQSEDMDAAALKAAKAWRFEPVMKEGKPVPTTAAIPFKFKLE